MSQFAVPTFDPTDRFERPMSRSDKLTLLMTAADLLRAEEQHTASAVVVNAVRDIFGSGDGGPRSREPMDRTEAERRARLDRRLERAKVRAACSKTSDAPIELSPELGGEG